MSKTVQIDDLELAGLREELQEAAAVAAGLREEMREKMRQIAREFRVPLATILGFSDILSARDKTHAADWNQIAIAGHQLMELIKNLERPTCETTGASNHTDVPEATETSAPPVRTVLHIEDNETNFRLTERILEDRPNIELLWAATGAQGVETAIKQPPTLILLDLNLPDIHGSDVLVQLRNNPATANIPVIVLSADASPSRIERMLAAGARNYLIKPFDIQRFLFLIDEALHSAQIAV